MCLPDVIALVCFAVGKTLKRDNGVAPIKAGLRRVGCLRAEGEEGGE